LDLIIVENTVGAVPAHKNHPPAIHKSFTLEVLWETWPTWSNRVITEIISQTNKSQK